jgi:hypothetical protein
MISGIVFMIPIMLVALLLIGSGIFRFVRGAYKSNSYDED